jgi:hypothetical protein
MVGSGDKAGSRGPRSCTLLAPMRSNEGGFARITMGAEAAASSPYVDGLDGICGG